MAGLGKKKEQRRAKQAEKRAFKKGNQAGSSSSAFTTTSSENVIQLGPDEFFASLKENCLDVGPLGFVMDGVLRNLVRMTVEKQAPRFGALPLLLGKNLVYIQLVVLDEDRVIQGKLYMTGSQVKPNALDVIKRSRMLFKEAVPYLLKDTENWCFSRSLVFKGYNGVIDEAVKFSEYDPIGGLLEQPSLEKDYGSVRCAEVFLFVAGDFEVKDEGMCSIETVKELLFYLNSEEGMTKLLAFDCVAASTPVTKQKLEELKAMNHLSLVA